MTKKNYKLIFSILLLLFIIISFVAIVQIKITHSPKYIIEKSISETFLSLKNYDDFFNTFHYYMENNFSQQGEFTLNNISTKGFDSNNLGLLSGTSCTFHSIANGNEKKESGDFAFSYTSIPVLDGEFSINQTDFDISSPTFFDGYLSMPVSNIDQAYQESQLSSKFPTYTFPDHCSYSPLFFSLSSIDAHFNSMIASFHSNYFEKIDEQDSIIPMNDINNSFNIYKVSFSESFQNNINEFLNDFKNDSIVSTIFANYTNLSMDELYYITNESPDQYCYFYIDSQTVLRRICFPFCIQDTTYYLQLSLEGDDDPLSACSLTISPITSNSTDQFYLYASANASLNEASIKWRPSHQSTLYTLSLETSKEKKLLQTVDQLSISFFEEESTPSSIDALITSSPSCDSLYTCIFQLTSNLNAKSNHFSINLLSASIHLNRLNIAIDLSGKYELTQSDLSPTSLSGKCYPIFSLNEIDLQELDSEIQQHIDNSKVLKMILY